MANISTNQISPSLHLCRLAAPLRLVPPSIFFIFFSQPHTRSSLSPGTDTQSRHSYSGSASEGAGERASLWKLGNSRILVLNRRPPFLITEVRRLAFPTLSSLLLMAALTLRFETGEPRFTFKDAIFSLTVVTAAR